jgi:PAS domain-containing protein
MTVSDEASHEDAALLRAAFRACPAVVILTSQNGIIVDATYAAAAFLNVEIAFLQRKPLLHFVARRDTKRFRAFVNEGARDAISVELRPRHASPRPVRITIQPAAGRLIWFAEPLLASRGAPDEAAAEEAPESGTDAAEPDERMST